MRSLINSIFSQNHYWNPPFRQSLCLSLLTSIYVKPTIANFSSLLFTKITKTWFKTFPILTASKSYQFSTNSTLWTLTWTNLKNWFLRIWSNLEPWARNLRSFSFWSTICPFRPEVWTHLEKSKKMCKSVWLSNLSLKRESLSTRITCLKSHSQLKGSSNLTSQSFKKNSSL